MDIGSQIVCHPDVLSKHGIKGASESASPEVTLTLVTPSQVQYPHMDVTASDVPFNPPTVREINFIKLNF